MSKTTAYYHIVFCTKQREMTIPLTYKNDLYRFIWNLIDKNKCTLLRIGGIQNHIHMLINVNPTVALAKLIQEIKAKSSGWLSTDNRFPHFQGWATGYYACTISPEQKDVIIEYIKNQETHHKQHATDDEFKSLFRYAQLNYHSMDLTD